MAAAGAAWGKMSEGKEIVTTRGAVAGEPEDAARAGARALEAGGNAMDAAAATCLAACVLEPEATDIGGYVCCGVVREGATGRAWSLDANSVAPAAARETMYEILPLEGRAAGINANEYQCAVRDDANVYGPLAVGVPGVLGGIGMLWERWGKLKWPEIVAPSQKLTADGFRYGSTAEAISRTLEPIRRFDATAKHLMPAGKLPKADDTWRRAGLDQTLERLASAGWRDFYEGEIGRRIADYVSSAGGALTRADMQAFRPRVTAPYESSYRDATLWSAVLPNGGLSTLQILNMLECWEASPKDDAAWWHRLAEVLKLAWRDRLRYVADPEFADVPVGKLLSKEYAAGRVETLRQFPEKIDRLPASSAAASPGTIHISAGDVEGNLVAVTISHGGLFGSCVTVPGTGIILGHGMCRFDPRPGQPNSVAPRKRPLNNTAPLIVAAGGRHVALGLRGGRRIVSVSAQLVRRVVEQGAGPQAAGTAPRLHLEGQEPLDVSESFEAPMVEALKAMGHRVRRAPVGGWAHLVEVRQQRREVRAGGGVWAAGV